MGNSHSHSRTSPHGLDVRHAPSTPLPIPVPALHRKRSRAFSVLTLGCASSAPYAPSLPSYREYPIKEDGSVSDRDEKRSLTPPPPLYALAHTLSADAPDDAAALAYRAFIKDYPQYQLTWLLDALRRADFTRLDRSGETYVDYMGGSQYPDSLIRAHAGFLQRNILGNTHSVSNA